jgi:hypothetical protein
MLHVFLKCLYSQQFHAISSASHPITYRALAQ